MSKSGFGAPKPLPGQSGYKVSISQSLEREAKEMEDRLKMLQDKMQQQSVEDTTSKSHSSGSRWKSASDKASIRSYAKDVQEKHKKKTTMRADPAAKATAAARRTARQQSSSGGFKSKDVEKWTVSDVGDWLESCMLSVHKDVFASNQISGPILLDISLDDLDYMGVTILGHRKVILKGIEDLRQNKRVTKQLFAPTDDTTVARSSHSSEGRSAMKAPSASTSASNTSHNNASSSKHDGKVHWSALEPLSSNPVSGGGDYDMVNGADSQMMLDEEAERKAFQEAVMEWRRGTSTTEKGGKSMSISAYGDANTDPTMWSDPFASESSQRVPSLTTDATGMEEGRGGGGVIVSARSQGGAGGKGSLAEGTLDEEKEQAEFKAAVEAWRTGKTTSHLKSTAERLAQDMDRDHETSAQKLLENQNNMRLKMEQACRELEEAKKRLASSAGDMTIETAEDDVELDVNTTEYVNFPASQSEEKFHALQGHRHNSGNLSPCSSLNDSDGEDEEHAQSHVEVSLIESTLHVGEVGAVDSAPYSVDEPSSDEEDNNVDEMNDGNSSGVQVDEI